MGVVINCCVKTHRGHQWSDCGFSCEQLWFGKGTFGCLRREEDTGSVFLKPLKTLSVPAFEPLVKPPHHPQCCPWCLVYDSSVPVPLSISSVCFVSNWSTRKQVGQETGELYQSKYTLILGAVWIGLLILMVLLHSASGIVLRTSLITEAMPAFAHM